MQSHKCAFLVEGDLCRNDDHCQYKLSPVVPYHLIFLCGKDQIIALEQAGIL